MLSRTQRLNVILLVVAMLLPAPLSFAEDSITWMEALVPPVYVHEGASKGQGYEDVITDILEESLTGYKYDTLIGNVARMHQELKDGNKVCNVGLYKTPEREQFVYFSSVPSTFTLPNVIITRKNNLKLFGDSKQVRLDDVLREGKLTLGVDKDRSYGKTIDAILKKHEGQGKVFVYGGEAASRGFLKMLLADRVEGLLGLPEEAIYLAEELGAKDEIVTISLAENEDDYDSWVSYVACSKTEWGKQLIGKINQILLEQRSTERYRGAYERWLDANSIENYRKMYDEVFLKATR